jgi:hypothetical protein
MIDIVHRLAHFEQERKDCNDKMGAEVIHDARMEILELRQILQEKGKGETDAKISAK